MAELNSRPIFEVEKTPSDCWDWITREDATRHALAAFELARRHCVPPAGERFVDEAGHLWCGRDYFLECLTDCFAMRVKAMAHDYGLGAHYAGEASRLKLWEKPEGATS